MFFLPAFGYLLLIMGVGLFLLYHWDAVRAAGWGDKRVIGCLLFIVLAIALSGTNANGIEGKIAPLGMGLALFACYLTARVIGKDIFFPLAAGAAVASLGVIAYSIIHPGQYTGGFIFEKNYDILTGYVLLGAALAVTWRWQWLLAALATATLLLSGSPEALFALAILLPIVLWRRDWGKRLIATVSILAVIVAGLLVLGYGQTLYSYASGIIRGSDTVLYTTDDNKTTIVSPLDVRLLVARDALANIKPLGDGYNLTGFTRETVHNVPLIIVQQLGWPGILAGLMWLGVSIWCLIRTKWKYAWTLILALSVFDHYIWTQLAPIWWMLIGVSTSNALKSDLIFRRNN